MSGRRFDAGGARIDRARTLSFTFEGRSHQGFVGDTLASALLANGVSVVGRSFKYHRPRGVIAAGAEEPNALMQLETGAHATANVPATRIALYDGLEARAVNCLPSAAFDVGEVNNVLARFFPAGFYYKTFFWPKWEFYEPIIRRAAGLGRAADQPDPDFYDNQFAHCDVLVVGGGRRDWLRRKRRPRPAHALSWPSKTPCSAEAYVGVRAKLTVSLAATGLHGLRPSYARCPLRAF
ncbi:MAG: 2Fe-2S iron-sulfur cluster-binding protein [Hyphomonadaceae bacterium JAD_PAG50586_4]|nr:MAG: 2Fe-2S iron-sulfur cluster-binding protein [Hyphomonadaceae bacterium JAD_PAG50586_4]